MSIKRNLVTIGILKHQLDVEKEDVHEFVRETARKYYSALNGVADNNYETLLKLIDRMSCSDWNVDLIYYDIDIICDYSHNLRNVYSIPLEFFLDENKLIAFEAECKKCAAANSNGDHHGY